ncbi:MAG: hypothetical protein AAF572_26885 [Cyanobacteria bacterium P01_B01_bin.77]
MKPVTYFATTPAIESLCANYGPYLENLSIPDRLALTKGLTECLLQTVGYEQDCSLIHACKADGHVFGNGTVQGQILLEGLIESVDQELTAREAAQLAISILQTVYSL